MTQSNTKAYDLGFNQTPQYDYVMIIGTQTDNWQTVLFKLYWTEFLPSLKHDALVHELDFQLSQH